MKAVLRMIKKFSAVCLIILSFLIVLSGCDFFTSYFELDGISDSMHEAVAEHYGLTIPDTAEFVRGHIDKGFRDPCIIIIFRVPQNDLPPAMDGEWNVDEYMSTTIDGVESEQAYFRAGKQDKYQRHAQLFVTSSDENGNVLVMLDGANPGTNWID